MAVTPVKDKSGKKGKDIKSLTGRQKAAIFLVSVGSEISAKVMEQLREDEVEKLTFEIARLETIEPEINIGMRSVFTRLTEIGYLFASEAAFDLVHIVIEISKIEVHKQCFVISVLHSLHNKISLYFLIGGVQRVFIAV